MNSCCIETVRQVKRCCILQYPAFSQLLGVPRFGEYRLGRLSVPRVSRSTEMVVQKGVYKTDTPLMRRKRPKLRLSLDAERGLPRGNPLFMPVFCYSFLTKRSGSRSSVHNNW